MSAAAEEARQGFGMAAPGQLPAGLDAETPTKKGAAKKRKAEVAQPSRRSLREHRKLTPKAAAALAGEGDSDDDDDEVDVEFEEAKALRSAKAATVSRKAKAVPAEAVAELDEPNATALLMSDGQLRMRIKRIANQAKLKSFIAALAECGMDELAKEARRKLAAVKAGTEAEPADVEYEPRASDDGEEEEEEEWSPRRRR